MAHFVFPADEAEARRIDESWGSLKWLASKRIGNAEEVRVGRFIIKKDRSNPKHSHPNCEEVPYLLCGRLEHTVGDRTVILEAGDTLVVRPGVPHNAINIGDEDADMIVVYSSGEREFKLEE